MGFKGLKVSLLNVAMLGLLSSPTTDPTTAPRSPTTTHTKFIDNTVGQEILLPNAAKDCYLDKYADVVMNAKTGDVITSYNAHKKLYPASMTKMMTVLLALEDIDAGKWDMDTKLTVPRMYFKTEGLAKVGLKEGQKITLRQALLFTHVVSAADAARTIAVNAAGTEEAFVLRMNQKASDLGMCDTHFKNASGDRDDTYTTPQTFKKGGAHAQVSTPYDMALLIKALAEKEKYQDFLATKKVYKAGRKNPYNNHALNLELLDEGVVCAKTGFISASGYNIAAQFDDNKIIVLYGARKGRRTKYLLDLKHTADSLYNVQQKPVWPDVAPLKPTGLDRANIYTPQPQYVARNKL